MRRSSCWIVDRARTAQFQGRRFDLVGRHGALHGEEEINPLLDIAATS